MNIGVLYMITTAVCLLQLISIYFKTVTTQYAEAVDRPFVFMVRFFAIFCVVDFFWGFFSSKEYLISQFLFTAVSYCYHSFAAFSAFIWLGYILHYTNASEKEKKVLNIARGIILTAQIVAIASNFFTHDAFEVSPECDYAMGSLRPVLYLLQFSYFLVIGVYCLYKMGTEKEKAARYRDAMLFSLVPLLFGFGQYLFYDAALYSLGFMNTAFVIYTYIVTAQREEFLTERFQRLDKKQSSIINGLAGSFVTIYYVDLATENFDIFRRSPDGNGMTKEESFGTHYFNSVREHGDKFIYEGDLDLFHEQFDRERILKELEDKNIYTQTYRIVMKDGLRYFQYRFVRPLHEDESDKLIVGVYDVDTEVRAEIQKQEERRMAEACEISLRLQAEKLSIDANIDALTGMYNRRAYEDDLQHYPSIPSEPDFVYFSLDLNGLKVTNDTIGHDAGDELLKGAAFCMSKSFAPYGKLYRIGGDEFAAMIFADKEKLQEIIQDFEDLMYQWTGKLVSQLSVSYGYAAKAEYPSLTIPEMAKVADKRMYEAKALFYAKKGLDRRGQQEAFRAVCNTYVKILRINLSADSYSVISVNEEEQEISEQYQNKLSLWLSDFIRLGFVHPEDIEDFYEHVGIEAFRNHFAKGASNYCTYYRRKIDGEYHRIMLELIPSKDYTPENQIVFLYVKNIHI